MNQTGIVRRIDDLGRVVIPKEIRRLARIREGDSLEIIVQEDGTIRLKKYSHLGQISEFAQEYCDSLYESTGHICLIGDQDNIIAVAGGSKKDYLDNFVSDYADNDNWKDILTERKVFIPISCDEINIGAVILLANDNFAGKFDNFELEIAKIAASFLSKQMEV